MISFTKQQAPISSEDLEALYAANQLSLNTPEILVNTAWFYTILYFGKRDRANKRAMKPGDPKHGAILSKVRTRPLEALCWLPVQWWKARIMVA